MSASIQNGRLHDPSLHELTAQLDGFRELMDERDKRYAALAAAQDRFNALVAEEAKDAVLKAETAQRGVNERQNEFRGQLSDQAATFMPRKESEANTAAIREMLDREMKLLRQDIANLRELRERVAGHASGVSGTWGAIIGVAGVVIAIAALFLK